MATTITWIIEQMWVKPVEDGQDDVVVTAAWRCNGVDGDYTATAYGTAGFTLEQGGDFIPYDQLTQDEVLNWCWSGSVDKATTESNIESQIQEQINPTITTPPLPW